MLTWFIFNCRLEEPILEILYGSKPVFTRSAITPPKVNWFEWNLEHCEQNVGGWPWQILGSSDSLRGIVFPKKTQKSQTKFLGLATSGRHNSAVITDHRKFTSKWFLYGMSNFYFLALESIQSLFPSLYVPYKKGTYPNFRQRPVSDIAY